MRRANSPSTDRPLPTSENPALACFRLDQVGVISVGVNPGPPRSLTRARPRALWPHDAGLRRKPVWYGVANSDYTVRLTMRPRRAGLRGKTSRQQTCPKTGLHVKPPGFGTTSQSGPTHATAALFTSTVIRSPACSRIAPAWCIARAPATPAAALTAAPASRTDDASPDPHPSATSPTANPTSASATAVARPIPRLAPVTMATAPGVTALARGARVVRALRPPRGSHGTQDPTARRSR